MRKRQVKHLGLLDRGNLKLNTWLNEKLNSLKGHLTVHQQEAFEASWVAKSRKFEKNSYKVQSRHYLKERNWETSKKETDRTKQVYIRKHLVPRILLQIKTQHIESAINKMISTQKTKPCR